MRHIALTLSAVAIVALVGIPPAAASPPTARGCEPTFDTVVGLEAAVAYLEAAWGRPLTPHELEIAELVFANVDRNADDTICVKIASVVPAPFDPVPQAIDNHLPA